MFIFSGKRDNGKFDDAYISSERMWDRDLICPKIDFERMFGKVERIEFFEDKDGPLYLYRNSLRSATRWNKEFARWEEVSKEELPPFVPSYRLSQSKLVFVVFSNSGHEDVFYKHGEWCGEPQLVFSMGAWEKTTSIKIEPTSPDIVPPVIRIGINREG